MVHSKFAVVSIDKISSHVAFVCQEDYAQVLIKEVGLNNFNNITSTFALGNLFDHEFYESSGKYL